jgi:TRAP-type C4-dicarboxylate transport system substrate-binding protein
MWCKRPDKTRNGELNNGRNSIVRAAVTAAALVLSLTAMLGPARAADDKTYAMKISLAALNDPLHQFAKDYAAALEKDSGGRIKPEIYPASQLGSIPRQIEGTQFGAIQCVVTPPEFFVGVDERFEVMAAPGLVSSMEHGQRLSADPQVLKLMLGLGADKGLRGVALLMSTPSSIVAKSPIRHLADLKGKKLRTFASQFQTEAFGRLGVTAVAMSLGDVLPALQQGAIDGAVAGTNIFAALHFQDAGKYITETGQPGIFGIAEVSKKWYDALPLDLQQIVDRDAAAAALAVNPEAIAIDKKARDFWTAGGGELITLPPDEQAEMIKTLASAATDVSKEKPAVSAAYQIVTEAAARTR